MKVKTIAIILSILLIMGFSSYLLLVRATADEVMQDFHDAKGRAEDMLMDPLILHASIVKERVIEEIKNPGMDKRRYAIGFLGNERIKEALPTLRYILENPQEKDYFRADALESIYQIVRNERLEKANQYRDSNGCLGHIAKSLLAGTYAPYQRTYFSAFVGRHD